MPPLKSVTGYRGRTNAEGKLRIYPDADLTHYYEVDEDKFRHAEPLEGSLAGNHVFWLDGDAELTVGPAPKPAEGQAAAGGGEGGWPGFLRGAIVQAHLAQAAQGYAPRPMPPTFGGPTLCGGIHTCPVANCGNTAIGISMCGNFGTCAPAQCGGGYSAGGVSVCGGIHSCPVAECGITAGGPTVCGGVHSCPVWNCVPISGGGATLCGGVHSCPPAACPVASGGGFACPQFDSLACHVDPVRDFLQGPIVEQHLANAAAARHAMYAHHPGVVTHGGVTVCGGVHSCPRVTCGGITLCGGVRSCPAPSLCGLVTCGGPTLCGGIRTCGGAPTVCQLVTCDGPTACGGIRTCGAPTACPRVTCGGPSLCGGIYTCDARQCIPPVTKQGPTICGGQMCPHTLACNYAQAPAAAAVTHGHECVTLPVVCGVLPPSIGCHPTPATVCTMPHVCDQG